MSQKMSLGKVRPATAVGSKLEKKLTAYMAVAGTACVGLAVASQPAEAKVVYTKADIGISGLVPIDLNGDGVVDFNFIVGATGNQSVFVVTAPAGNGWFGNTKPLFFGVPVGPGEKFGGSYARLATFSHYGSLNQSNGPWHGVTNRFLGVKFAIAGKNHYGWIRMTVVNQFATITGYAYETVPNASIKTGYVSGAAEVVPTDEVLVPAARQQSLGMLARGTDGLALWRRENEKAA